MDKKIEIRVSYPWAGITDDKEIIYTDENTNEDEISEIAYEWALDMIFGRGVSWTWEEIK